MEMQRMNNEMQLYKILNSCRQPRRIYNALMVLAEPGIEQADDVREKRQVLIGKILPVPHKSECNQQLV